MPIHSYLVITNEGACSELAARLDEFPGCDVLAADNRDVLLLVTESDSAGEEAALLARIEDLPDIRGLVLALGEIDPDTTVGDPLASGLGRGTAPPSQARP